MKIRRGFVTNSSSSSFILSFKNEDDYKEFEENCEEFGYKDVFNLINNLRLRDLNGDIDEDGTVYFEKRNIDELRKICLEEMEHFFTWESVHNYLEKRTNHIKDFKERILEEEKIKETQEFKDFYKSLFVKRDYKKELDDYFNQQIEKLGKDNYMKILSSYEYRILRHELIKNNRYFDGIEKIKNDEIIIEGTIWDTNGGLLEWAIRNGLLELEFSKWVRMVENIG